MSFVADTEDSTVRSPLTGALYGLSEQAFTPDQWHKLHWMLAPTQRPEPGTAATAQNNRSDFHGMQISDEVSSAKSFSPRYRTSGEAASPEAHRRPQTGRRNQTLLECSPIE